ncbi:hypothetical protein D3C78_97320 [compost metagenome]
MGEDSLNENLQLITELEDIHEKFSSKVVDLNLRDNGKFNTLINYIEEIFSEIIELKKYMENASDSLIISVGNNFVELVKLLQDFNLNNIDVNLHMFMGRLLSIRDSLMSENKIELLQAYGVRAKSIIDDLNKKKIELETKIQENEILSDDLKNKKVNEIFEDDSEKFKNLARRYEIAFYIALAFLFLYFFGWYIEIDTANFKFKFAEQFYENHTPTFYVQKISLIILSTTLAAFLLKRSFMNRRLADEAYRTAKELDALPRYMEGMPEEMKEKIRFDLAYKYFGNGIHHESYTGGENLMHENIKANTDFIKAVKDLSPKVEVPKAEATKEEKPDKAVA